MDTKELYERCTDFICEILGEYETSDYSQVADELQKQFEEAINYIVSCQQFLDQKE